jgi:rhodanese-related sulfurtransferase
MAIATSSMAVGSLERKAGRATWRRRAPLRCALATTLAILTASPSLAIHGTPVPILTIEPEYAKRLLDGGQQPTFVDLRLATEFAQGRLPRALSIPLSELRRRHSAIPRTQLAILYCDCPTAEINAAFQFLVAEGYQNVSVLAEGFRAWVKRGYPVER